MGTHIYQAKGRLAKRIKEEYLDEREKVFKASIKFAKLVGGVDASFSLHGRWGVIFKKDSKGHIKLPPCWKLDKHNDVAYPKLSTKEGKLLQREMSKPEYRLPQSSVLEKIVGLSHNDTVYVDQASYGIVIFHMSAQLLCGKVIFNCPTTFTPKSATRISDIQYEKLLAKEKEERKSRAVKKP